MFISDEHVLLDILPIHLNYADRPARSIAHLRVIAEAAALLRAGIDLLKR
tara:strand:+ start:200 stop:349 length:150 start_codon:yes stop_codon:yes gene_type:complete